ncbi:MAG: hypothetical protein O3B13_02645 [Planctomycetota bacterium]|nr:hypothetical protein [Planctomycetota bacterium]
MIATESNHAMISAQRAYSMLGNETLWETAALCDRALREAGIAYSVCGGVAACLHGYQRNTVDLDLIVQSEDSERIREVLRDAGLEWHPVAAEFRSNNGIAVQFLMAGESAGRGLEVRIPEPVGDSNVETIEGLTVVRLSRLIEMKLACGSANVRRTHKDFADVVELIDIRNLDSSFARFLHKSLRKTFRELVRRVRAE